MVMNLTCPTLREEKNHNAYIYNLCKKQNKITLIKDSVNECDQLSVNILSVRDIEESVI